MLGLGTINRDCQKVRAEWAERRVQSIDEWVGEEIAKLDGLEDVLWKKLEALDDVGEIEKMTSQILKVADRRAKLLGLDAPTRMKIGADESLAGVLERVSDAKERLYNKLTSILEPATPDTVD
jgi:hypothetical protein